ncbi:MAG: hypothetical protein VSS75_030685 [Candidatus Parabeggiatoa sp.]|nr:hypothetical protein [Candidatus Parabeggiatoa sp.]
MKFQKQDVFVVLPFSRDWQWLRKYQDKYQFHWLKEPGFRSPTICPKFDLVKYVEKCSDYIRYHNIQAVLYSHDLASLVAACLCEKHGFIGPNVESMFLCLHKYYSRHQEIEPIWFDYIDFRSEDWQQKLIHYPCYIKPAFLIWTLLQYRIHSFSELEMALGTIKLELPSWFNTYYDFFNQYVDTRKYPLAVKDMMVVEELVTNASQHVVEGWATPDGTLHVWAVSDSNYYLGSALSIDNYSTPSRMPTHAQQEMIRHALEIVHRHGVTGGFWNVELWWQEGKCKTTEVNGRSSSVWQNLYLGVYGKSLYQAMLHLSCGYLNELYLESPYSLRSDALCVGGQFHVITYAEGLATELFDFEFIHSRADLKITLLIEENDWVFQTRTSGACLAYFELFGENYESICYEAETLRRRMVKQPDCSPWLN